MCFRIVAQEDPTSDATERFRSPTGKGLKPSHPALVGTASAAFSSFSSTCLRSLVHYYCWTTPMHSLNTGRKFSMQRNSLMMSGWRHLSQIYVLFALIRPAMKHFMVTQIRKCFLPRSFQEKDQMKMERELFHWLSRQFSMANNSALKCRILTAFPSLSK